MVFFCSSISVVLFDSLGVSRCHNTLSLSSPHLGPIHDLFASYVDSLMVREIFLRTKRFEPLQKLMARF